jgi:aminodeoxychorismate synthase, subunit I (EC 6.3.5.8)/aminodeoxychorismate synthase, glutamine amidotransferase subunit (EC 6.3.5.8)
MIFIVDNFDSFTYNLYQYFGELGEEVIVRRKDNCTLQDIEVLNPELIVISPGPCRPEDSPVSLEIIQYFRNRIPILGICLGHQAIGQVFGGQVVRAKVPTHGKTSLIKHDGQGVFLNLANPLLVTRYHSLVIERSGLPADLIITAETADKEIMGFRHNTFPIESVQFHPEAILSECGHELLKNAINNARKWRSSLASPWQTRHLALSVSPHLLFNVFKESLTPFFLDSGKQYPDLGRYSYMGANPFLKVSAYADKTVLSWPENSREKIHPKKDTNSLLILDTLHTKYRVSAVAPFPFSGGAVGFFSYDLKNELEPHLPQLSLDDLALPYWRLAWYDGIVIYDHLENVYWLTACGMMENGECSYTLANKRLDKLEKILTSYNQNNPANLPANDFLSPSTENSKIQPGVKKAQYLEDLRHVLDFIFAGDIYQANLTQRFSLDWKGDSWKLYQQLHELNPAPFAAFLPYSDLQILCSSPERFIRIQRDGCIETRPIKGTRPRGSSSTEDQALAQELQNSAKDKAELTMIIDLERNDLGRICKIGTIKVPALIELEKYPTVWHLVSTITGQLKNNLFPSEILRAVFPGGSITGAPKIRAMEIIEELEPYRRGIYTGSIGYLGFDGAWDLNIVIRTILLKDGKAYLHAGGGIVADSQPEQEYTETIVKARALFTVLGGELDE